MKEHLTPVAVKIAEWLLIAVRNPGGEPVSGGALLIDHSSNTLRVRVRQDLYDLDPDILEVLQLLQDDLASSDRDASELVSMFESEWSNSITLGRRHAFRARDLDLAFENIFRYEVASSLLHRQPLIGRGEILKAQADLPYSTATVIELLRSLNDPHVDLSEPAHVAMKDPVISASLIRLANSALVGSSSPVRSVNAAIARLGTQVVAQHVTALSIRHAFAILPGARNLWEHSLAVAQIARQLAKETSAAVKPEEVTLAALVHDIGRLVTLKLSDYTKWAETLTPMGYFVTEVERRLLGTDHTEIGSELLRDWHFPEDIVEAVLDHHNVRSTSALAEVIQNAEKLSGADEDMRTMMGRLAQSATTEARTSLDADLFLLSYSATA